MPNIPRQIKRLEDKLLKATERDAKRVLEARLGFWRWLLARVQSR